VSIYIKYCGQAAKVASACAKAVRLCDSGEVPRVSDVFDSDGKLDLHLTHDDFSLRQVILSSPPLFISLSFLQDKLPM
jgi:hypothetical protein